MVKIAVVGSRNFPADYGGVETATEGLYKKLAEKGHEIIFYGRNKANTYEKTEYAGVQVINLPTIDAVGIGTFFHCFISSFFAAFSDADIIHYHAQGPSLFNIIPKILSPSKKIGFTCQGIDWQRDKWQGIAKKVIKQGEVHSAKYTDFRIMVSGGLGQRYSEVYGVDWVRIPNGVNIPKKYELNNMSKKFDIEKDKYIIFVGRLVPEKAPDILIRAYKEILTDVKLLLVGDSPETPNYVKELKELAKDDDRIVFTSHIRGTDLAEIYSNALAYVSPSKLEGNPLTGLEAMSYELPMVLSDIQPHDEMLSYDRSAGISFKTNDISACKEAIERLLVLPFDDSKARGHVARKIVEDYYNWDKIAADTEKIYLQVLES